MAIPARILLDRLHRHGQSRLSAGTIRPRTDVDHPARKSALPREGAGLDSRRTGRLPLAVPDGQSGLTKAQPLVGGPQQAYHPRMPREVNVHLLPRHFDPDSLCGGMAVVIDLLRATTTIISALANGARCI